MTTDADFKALVRARMGRTGENYTTARQALLEQQPEPAGRGHQPGPEERAPVAGPGEGARPAPDPSFEGEQGDGPAPDPSFEKAVRSFFDGDRLRSIPTRRRPRVAVLLHLLQRFEVGRAYSEREVNGILRTAHDDISTLRRELVDYRYLLRQDGIYQVTQTVPERDANEAQEVPTDEAARLAALPRASS